MTSGANHLIPTKLYDQPLAHLEPSLGFLGRRERICVTFELLEAIRTIAYQNDVLFHD